MCFLKHLWLIHWDNCYIRTLLGNVRDMTLKHYSVRYQCLDSLTPTCQSPFEYMLSEKILEFVCKAEVILYTKQFLVEICPDWELLTAYLKTRQWIFTSSVIQLCTQYNFMKLSVISASHKVFYEDCLQTAWWAMEHSGLQKVLCCSNSIESLLMVNDRKIILTI